MIQFLKSDLKIVPILFLKQKQENMIILLPSALITIPFSVATFFYFFSLTFNKNLQSMNLKCSEQTWGSVDRQCSWVRTSSQSF
jgi:hypothetical protein